MLLLVANVGFWLRETILDSGAFTNRVEAVLEKPEGQDHLGELLARQTIESGEIQDRVAEVLPDEIDFLPFLVEAQAQDLLKQLFSYVLGLDTTRAVVVEALPPLHQLLVDTLKGQREGLDIEDDSLVLDLREVVSLVLERLGIDEPDAVEERLDDWEAGRIVLVSDVQYLDMVSIGVRTVNTATPILIVLSLGLLVAGVVVSNARESSLLRTGYAVAIVGLVSLLIWRISGWVFAATMDAEPLARMMLNELLTNYRLQSLILILIGVVICLAANARVRSTVAQLSADGRVRVEKFGTGKAFFIAVVALTLLILIL